MTSPHVPSLAAGVGDGAVRRSLLLAGGGIRVAYQAGALVALEEAGVRFAHMDGTSGGIFNLAMLLSGLTPGEACERWRTLELRRFAALPPLRRLVRGPPYPALGSSSGLRRHVLPGLGVDPARIRAATGVAGTFNVCDFGEKAVHAVPHEQADEDLLVAAVTLPMFSPAVRRAGRTLVDAVWIKDVNVAEAVRRGAEELWLIWCIGNHGAYADGVFRQYVHMIELSANGSLQEELAAVPAGVRLRVIRPEVPLPLDPDLLLGRIDAATLIAMGYRDAIRELGSAGPGAALDGSATRMRDPRPGVGFRETLAGGALEVRLGWEVEDLAAFAAAPEPAGTVVGDVSHPRLGSRRLGHGGRFAVREGVVEASLSVAGGSLVLRRRLRSAGPVEATLRDAHGSVLHAGALTRLGGGPRRTLHARGVTSPQAGARTVASAWRWALRAR